MKKRPINQKEKAYVALAVSKGCLICRDEAEFHHLPGAREVGAYCIGFPLCPKHHTGKDYPGQSIHSSRLIFCGKHKKDELVMMQESILRIVADLKKQTVPF